ncbi:MAG: hypothetical protein HOP19_04810, partial [Acidobacteria bacterium]|nr:hypothetical protein [Acidobacteriota bacterium]
DGWLSPRNESLKAEGNAPKGYNLVDGDPLPPFKLADEDDVALWSLLVSDKPIKAKAGEAKPAASGANEPTLKDVLSNFVRDEEGSFSAANLAQGVSDFLSPVRDTTQHANEPTRWLNDIRSVVAAGTRSKKLTPTQAADALQIARDGLAALNAGDGAEYIRQRARAVEALSAKMSLGEKARDVINLPRALLSSIDLSFPFRQGAVGLLNLNNVSPRRALARATEFRDMFTAAASQRGFDDIRAELRGHPRAPLAEASGLYSATGSALSINSRLIDREESFASTVAEKLPVIGRGVKVSERAFTAAGDLQRLHLFDGFAKQLEGRGVKFDQNPKAYQDIANYVNAMTGRGRIHDKLKSLEPVLNGALFSPKFLASRLQVLNPMTYARMEPEARRIALKEVAGFAGAVTTVLGLAAASGAEVGLDPDSADFAKIKFGNTRYDVLGGLQQPMVFMFREGQALYRRQAGEKLSEYQTPGAIAERFARTKASPAAGFAYDAAVKNANFTGWWNSKEPFDYGEGVGSLIAPLFVRDLYQAIEAEGLAGLFKTLPAGLGVGVATYGDKPKATEKPTPKTKAEKRKQEDDEGKFWYPQGGGRKPWPPPHMLPSPPPQ